jgi:hypothetical protein
MGSLPEILTENIVNIPQRNCVCVCVCVLSVVKDMMRTKLC